MERSPQLSNPSEPDSSIAALPTTCQSLTPYQFSLMHKEVNTRWQLERQDEFIEDSPQMHYSLSLEEKTTGRFQHIDVSASSTKLPQRKLLKFKRRSGNTPTGSIRGNVSRQHALRGNRMGARNSRRENPKVPQIDPRGEKAAETGKEKQNKRLRARLRSYIGEQFCH